MLRLLAQPMHGIHVATQHLLNDLYRTLLGVKRADCVRVSELADRARCPNLNQIVAKQAAMFAWRSQNGDPWMTFLSSTMIGLGELPWKKESLPPSGALPGAI